MLQMVLAQRRRANGVPEGVFRLHLRLETWILQIVHLFEHLMGEGWPHLRSQDRRIVRRFLSGKDRKAASTSPVPPAYAAGVNATEGVAVDVADFKTSATALIEPGAPPSICMLYRDAQAASPPCSFIAFSHRAGVS